MKNKHFKTLLHLSGGLDSVYVAWRWMKDHPDEPLLLHHIYLRHPKEDRVQEEGKATLAAVNWFKENGMDNFRYISSSFDYGGLDGRFIKDVRIVSVFTAIVLTQYRHIRNYLRTRHKGETRTPVKKGEKMIMDAIRGMGQPHRRLNFVYVNAEKTRKQMMEEMPPELYEIVACCRHPIDGKPCRKCHTCKQFLNLAMEPK